MINNNSLIHCEGKVNYDKSLFMLIRNVAGMTGDADAIYNFLDNVSITSYGLLSLQELTELGFKRTAAQRLLYGLQLAIKLQEVSFPEATVIRSPEDAAEIFKYLRYENQEKFVVAALNTKNEVLAKKEVFVGSLNSCIVHPREVMSFALKHGAGSIVCAHQHPSGNPIPSPEDIEVTKRLVEAGKIMGIELLDHIIIGHTDHVSLKEKGYM